MKVADLCKNCDTYQGIGFSPLCKYCDNDGRCPECGEQLKMGMDLKGACFICPKGHEFDMYGHIFKG